MNPVQHANISVKRRGGELEDYIDIHALIDSTKMLCDNRHRILHTFWGVQEVIIPIFGHHFENSAGNSIEVKDLVKKIICSLISIIVLFQRLETSLQQCRIFLQMDWPNASKNSTQM
jgi:hypothetical protein